MFGLMQNEEMECNGMGRYKVPFLSIGGCEMNLLFVFGSLSEESVV